MTIVCLGWGSLIWNQGALPVIGEWEKDGPRLPIEFSRQTRNGRITLALASGAQTIPVLWAVLSVETMDDAVAELGLREGIPLKNRTRDVGVWQSGMLSQHDYADVIGEWGSSRGFDGIVWTALPTGLRDARGSVPTSDQVLSYLRGLSGSTQVLAEEYIRRAPEQTRTAYRAVIERELGWTPL